MRIGGNIQATVQVKGNSIKNSIGAAEQEWTDHSTIRGWLDLSSGDSRRTVFNAKVQESTHIFLCDYTELDLVTITSENARMVIQGRVYDVLLIDDPMQMHEHLEMYLRFVGGQNGD